MSDPTQENSSEAATGSTEPSMEDILASIRRIIAEDDDGDVPAVVSEPAEIHNMAEPAVSDSTDDLLVLDEALGVTADDFSSEDLEIPEIELEAPEIEAAGEALEDITLDIAETDDVILDIDNILMDADTDAGSGEAITETVDEGADVIDLLISEELDAGKSDIDMADSLNLDVTISEPAPAETDTSETELAAFDQDVDLAIAELADITIDAGDAEISDTSKPDLVDAFLDDIIGAEEPTDDVPGDLSIPEIETPDIEETAIETATDAASDVSESFDDEIDAVMEQELDALAEDPAIDDIVSEASATPDIAMDDLTAAGDSDIDLVKSLMADLTDTSFIDGDEAGPEIDLVKDEPSQFAEAADSAKAEQDAVLDDILDLTLDDEIAHSQIIDDPLGTGDIINAESGVDMAVSEMALDEGYEDELNPLLEIAAAAEADAEWVQVKAQETETASVETKSVEEAIAELSEDQVLEELESEILTSDASDAIANEEEEIPDMPKAAVSPEAIMDEVTETAAAGAFASLNQVVEEKAIEQDAGPRIGELVQDALRPMLKEWLDENLKGIVERAVAKEVKRISSGK